MSTTFATRPVNIEKFRAMLIRHGFTLQRHPDANPKDEGRYLGEGPGGYVHVYARVTPVRKLTRVHMLERFGTNDAGPLLDVLDAEGVEYASEHDEEDYRRLCA